MSPAKQPTTPITVTHAAATSAGPVNQLRLSIAKGFGTVVPTTGSIGAGFTRNRT